MPRYQPTYTTFLVGLALFGAVAVSAGVGLPSATAEEVVVTSETAAVKVKDEVIGHVESGDRFEVLERRGGWVAISFQTDGGTKRGWVLANHLRTQTDEAADAPEMPTVVAPGIEVELDSIQFSSQGNEGLLFARMSIENRSGSELAYDESDIRLLVDGEAVEPVDEVKRRYTSHRVYAGFASETSMRVRYSSELNSLGKGVLPPGQLVEGWLRFPVTQLRRGVTSLDNSFVIAGRIGDAEFKTDLREQSLANLDPRIRPSEFDPRVKVAEVFGGLNALSFTALRNLPGLDADSNNAQLVVVPKTDSFFLDQQVLDQLRSTSYAPSSAATPSPIALVRPESPSSRTSGYSRSTYVSNLPIFKTETEAVIQSLASRTNAVELLTSHLDDTDATVRAATCLGLAGHLGDGDAVRALLVAAKDTEPRVRAAAVQSLGGYGHSGSSYRRVNRAAAATPEVVETLVAAMADESTAVRTNAARAASRVSDPKVIEGLVRLLDDQESGVVAVACSSLGTLKAETAVDALRKLRQSEDAQRRTVAIRALGSIGELSPVETALAQLNEGTPTYGDFDILQKEPDRRAVEPLIQFLKGKNSNPSYIDKAARALGALADKRATDVLVSHLRYGNRYSNEIPAALGDLGDTAAIEPLREALTAEGSSSRRAAIYGALARLGDQGVLKELKQMLNKPDPAKLDTPAILKAIGMSRDDEATSLIAPYLDDQRYHRYAIEALIEQGTDGAYDALTKRLLAADYAFGSTMLSVLRSKQSPDTIALIRTAADSDNANTRRSAEAYIRSIDGGASDREKQHQALIGKKSTPFNAEHWINGTELKPEDFKNKVVLLDFWAVWCGPCIATFPHLRDWHERFADQGLEIIGVTRYYQYDWDANAKRPVRNAALSPEDENKALEAFVKHHDLKHRIAVLASDSKTMADFRVSGIPQAVLIDRAGKIRLIKVGSGETNAQAIEEMIQRSLQELDLSGESITDAELASYLQDAGEITKLNLQGSKITDEGLTALAALQQLESLRLDGTAVSDNGLELLAQQGNLGKLKVLGLSDTKVTTAGLNSLAGLSALEELAVAARGVDDQGLGAISKLASLQRLSLGDGWGTASITDQGLREISGMKQLQQLNLHGTTISDEGLKTLQSLSSLESIGLMETKVTPQGLAELAESLPELDVRVDQWSPWLTRSEYQSHFAGMVRKKFFPLQVEGRVGDDQPLYRGRFVPYPTDRTFVFKSMHATSREDYLRKSAEARRDEMTQVSLFSFRGAETDEMFNGTWVMGRLEAYWKTPMIVANRSLQQAARARADGDLEAAARAYLAALDARPENVRANILLAHTLRAMDQSEASTAAYERTVRIIDGIPEEQRTAADWGFLGQALYHLDRLFESRTAFNRVIEMRGEKEPVLGSGPRWWYLTMLLHRLGEKEQAVETFQTLAKQLNDGATKEQMSCRDEAAKVLGIAESTDQP